MRERQGAVPAFGKSSPAQLKPGMRVGLHTTPLTASAFAISLAYPWLCFVACQKCSAAVLFSYWLQNQNKRYMYAMEGFSCAKHIASISQMKPSSPSVALRLIGADRADAGFVVPTTTAPRAPSSGMRRLGRLRPSVFDAKVVVEVAARTGGAPGSAVVTRLLGFTFTASSTAGRHGDARDAMVGTAGAAQRTEGARLWKAATAPVSSERCATRRSMDNFVVGGVSARCWWRENKFGVTQKLFLVPNGVTPARCGPVILCVR